jgi:DNA polymerase-4
MVFFYDCHLMENQCSKIIHIDLDYFFAQVEERDKPFLKEKPFAVGGEENRGVVCTCNYVARKYGVRSAMPIFQALKICPELVVLRVNMENYKSVSRTIFSILYDITPDVESVSLDEAYLDVTNLNMLGNSATLISNFIREKIYKETGLTSSAGVAPSKLLAKIASGINKPNGLYVIAPHQVRSFIHDLKVENLMGVGQSTLSKLHDLNVYTCSQLQSLPIRALQQYFGKYGITLYNYSRGIDNREVIAHHLEKSISVESTSRIDLMGIEDCILYLDALYAKLVDRVSSKVEKKIDTLFVKITDTNFFKYSIMHKAYHHSKEAFVLLFKRLYSRHNNPPIRLIGIGVNLNKYDYTQLTLEL